MKVRLVYISDSQLPSPYANSVNVVKMCQAFSNNEYEIFLIGLSNFKLNKTKIFNYYNVDDSFRIILIPKINLRIIGKLFQSYLSVKKAKALNPDIIYTRNETTAYIATLNGLQTIFESHYPIYFSHWGKFREIVFKALIKSKNLLLIIAISESIKRYHLNNYNFDAEKIVLARDASDPINPKINYKSYSNNKELQVGYVGSLNKGRGLKVIESLAKNCKFAQFHIIGGLPKDIETWKNTINSNNVIFHGYVPHSNVNKYLLSFDIVLAPYQKMTMTESGLNTTKWMSPMKIFEYMAAGKTIIASDLPAIKEILINGETALLCNPENQVEWIEALNRLRNSNLRIRLAHRAYSEFIKNYTWDIRAKKIIKEISKNILYK